MLIYLGLLIPVVFIVGVIVLYRHRAMWWEYVALFAVPTLLIVGAKAMIETIGTTDTEYWGGYAVQAEYYEDWDEEVPCRHPVYCTRSYPCGDSKTPRTCTEQYECGKQHSYDVDYHPPEWQIVDSNHSTFTISSTKFEGLAALWKNRQFVDMHRSYHSDDGDKYVAVWDKLPESCEFTTSAHWYENRVAVSDSIFNYPEVDEKTRRTYGVFEYPAVNGYNQQAVLGVSDPAAEWKFQYLNAMLGAPKQVRVFVLVFKNQPLQASFEQEAHWKRSNKNEFVICIGVSDANAVQWARVLSWTEVEGLKVDTASHLTGQSQLDLSELATWLYPQIEKRWVRMPFAKFSYLTVEPPGWAIAITWILTAGLCFGLSWWFVNNEFDPIGDLL